MAAGGRGRSLEAGQNTRTGTRTGRHVAQSILEVARELIESPEAKAAYGEDPDGFMAARGLDALTAAELGDAVGFVAEAMPAPVARQLVTPTDSAADQLPLVRVAAATVMEAGVATAEPGTVDLTALVDPSGQLDLPTDGIATASEVDAAAVTEDPKEEEEEEADANASVARDVEEDSVATTTGPDDDTDESGFGTGAPDAPDETQDESDETGQTDATDDSGELDDDAGTDEGAPSFDPGTDTAPLQPPQTVPGKDDEPPEDDFEDVII